MAKKRSKDVYKQTVTVKVPRLAHAIMKILQTQQGKKQTSLGENLIEYMLANHPDIVQLAKRAIDLEEQSLDPYEQVIEDAKPQSHKRNPRGGQ